MAITHSTAVRELRRQELLNLLMMRVPLRDCAERLGVNLRTLQRDIALPEFRAELEVLTGRLRSKVVGKVVKEAAEEKTKVVRKLTRVKTSLAERIHEASGQAIDKLRTLIDSEHQGLALKACDSVLDRNPETARNQRSESDVRTRFSIDPATLMHIAMTAREIEGGNQSLIEGEVREEESYERTGSGNQGDREESRPDS